MILGIDIDGVLADIHGVACEQGNAKYGLCLQPNDIVTWDHAIRQGLSFSRLVYDVLDQPEVVRRLPLVPGALEGMAGLMVVAEDLGLEVRVITTRPDLLIEASTAWVRAHFGDLDVIVTQYKPKYCDLLIDDFPANIRAMVEAGKQAIVFDRLWNQDCPHPLRASWANMDEMVRMVLG